MKSKLFMLCLVALIGCNKTGTVVNTGTEKVIVAKTPTTETKLEGVLDTVKIDNKRAILIKGPVEEYNMNDSIQKLKKFASESKDPVFIIINTPGGDVIHGFELVNTIESLNKKNIQTTCIVESMAYSMGALIATYCNKTYMHKFSSLLFHEASYSASGSYSTINTRVSFTNRYLHVLNKDVASKLHLTQEEYEKKIHDEWWLTAQEAYESGIIAGVLDTVYYTIEATKPPESLSIFGESKDKLVQITLNN